MGRHRDLEELGRMIANRRLRAGLTQEELAARTALSVRTVRNIECGATRPRTQTVRRIAQELGGGGQDTERLLAAAAPDDPVRAVSVPAQLPLPVAGFVGRRRELDRLDAILAAGDSESRTTSVAVVSGTAGVGKTTLAVHWAHRVKDRFPDGQLYLNLRGFDTHRPAATAGEALRGALESLGVPPSTVTGDPDAQAALYRSLVARRRILVVLDNALDPDQVLPLLPSSPHSFVLAISRYRLPGLVAATGAVPISLDLLSTPEARELLSGRLGADRTAAEPQATEEITIRTARLPLALAIVAVRATMDPSSPLAALVAELRDAQGTLDAFDCGDAAANLRAVFLQSYRYLSDAEARVFRLLGRHPGPDMSLLAAASLAGIPLPDARAIVATLVRANLLTEHHPGRYVLHDLLRTYALELDDTTDAEAGVRAATRRMLDHYLQQAYAADRLLNPHRDPIELGTAARGITLEEIDGREGATEWFAREYATLLAIMQTEDPASARHVCQLAWALTTIVDLRGRWQDGVTISTAALAAAQRMADRSYAADAHRALGRAYIRVDRIDLAQSHLGAALDIYRQFGDWAGQADTHHTLTAAFDRLGQHSTAIEHATRARELYGRLGRRHGEAKAMSNIGWCHSQLGDYQQGVAFCRQALAVLAEAGDPVGQANVLHSLGYAYRKLRRNDAAADAHQKSIGLYRDAGDRYGQASAFARLGDAAFTAGEPEVARERWRAALRLFEELCHPEAGQVRTKLGGVAVRV
jgi:tetratricopeptide (TPR) repeat protein/transcriptional regulator with XRE-family HTH domain